MSDKNLLDPLQNELIPAACNEPTIEVPELSPGYVEPLLKSVRPPAAELDAIEDALRSSTADPIMFADGLQLRRDEDGAGGLDVWKNNPNRHIRDMASLEPDELRTIKNYLEGSK